MCRSKYYECRVHHLKKCSPAVWWVEIKSLGGVTNSSGTRHNVLKSIKHHLEGVSNLSPTDLANHVNTAFLAPTVSFEPLTYNPFRDSSVPCWTTLRVTKFQLYRSFLFSKSCLHLIPPKRRDQMAFQAGC